MLVSSESDLQKFMYRLNMVSVNYNMKINTKKTNVLRVSKGSESDNEDSSCRGNYRTSQGILLLRKHDLRRCHREIKRRIATAASIWFEVLGSWIRVKKIRFLQANFRKISIFFRQFYKRISSSIQFRCLVLIIVNRDLFSSTSFNTSFDMCSVQLIFSILRHTFISKASNLVMSSFPIVLISAQYKVTLQISVFTILFLMHLHSSQFSPW